MARPKTFDGTLRVAFTQQMRAALTAAASAEETSEAEIIRRAVRKELSTRR